MIADFAGQMVDPPRVRCIGVEMQPFSLGHLFILRQIGNAFVCGQFPTYEHLIAAAFVCAHTWEQNQSLLRTGFRKWLFLRVWGLLAGKFNVATQTVILKQFIDEAMEFPEPKAPERGSKVRHIFSSDDTRLYSFLRSRMSHSEAMNFPLRAANLMWTASLEEVGQDFKNRFELDRERQALEIVERLEREEGFAT